LVEILDGVRAVNLSEADGLDLEAYVLDCGDTVILVDTGMLPRHMERIEAELKDMGRNWGDLSIIFITHKHGDHIKNLAKVKKLTGAEVMAGEGDVRDIESATGVRIDRGLRHGEYFDICGGIEVIHVPGHSVGNLCLYLQKQKAIIAGDTIFGDEKGNIGPPPEKYCLDVKMAEKGIKRLLFYDFEALLLSHGKNLLKDAKNRVRLLCEEITASS